MSDIHYFQRYHQRENVVTNNTLLLFSRLYSFDPRRFESFLKEILEDAPIEVGVIFQQQSKNKATSIPDAICFQKSFRIVIETKLSQNYSEEQLKNHLFSFDNKGINVLLLLSPSKPSDNFIASINENVNKFEKKNSITIKFICTTFNKVISSFENVLNDYDFEMKEMIDDFKEFCNISNLLDSENYLMRALTCGWSLQENLENNLYYDLIERGFQKHKYIGVYANKSIRAIGEIENIICAELENGRLEIKSEIFKSSKDQINRIIKVIDEAKANNNWDLTKGHRYFLVKKFFNTDYKKTSPYPIQRSKYFDLRIVLDMNILPPTEEIANLLKSKEWK